MSVPDPDSKKAKKSQRKPRSLKESQEVNHESQEVSKQAKKSSKKAKSSIEKSTPSTSWRINHISPERSYRESNTGVYKVLVERAKNYQQH